MGEESYKPFVYLNQWYKAMDEVFEKLIIRGKEKVNGYYKYYLVDRSQGQISPEAEQLNCFLPGNIVLGLENVYLKDYMVSNSMAKPKAYGDKNKNDIKRASYYLRMSEELMHTCYSMYSSF